ncbi:MAG: alpha/beta hydrolase, partial [Proteobacteria bacterium]|nr:alpha/beta hydrolase [Pseudomonadota bacterium]
MLSSIFILLVVLLILNGWLYLQQPGMIFFPQRVLDATPEDWGFDYENVSLQTVDGLRLHGWFIPRPGSDRVVLFFHGNAGNISHRGDSVAIFHRLGLNVFIFDYRGYGQSEGSPGEAGLARDAVTAWEYLQQMRGYNRDKIIVFGRSLGGTVATRLAARVKPGALIVESTFSSARDMAGRIFPLVS